MAYRIFTVLAVTFCALLTAVAEDEKHLEALDRGHRIILTHGLQIQALGFGESGPTWWDDWEVGGFTGREFGWDWDGQDPGAKGLPVDATWATWLDTISPSATPYVDRLVRWQLGDEQDLRSSEHLDEVKAWLERWRPQVPNTLMCTSQFGNQFSVSVLQNYMKECQPDMLYFNHYVFGRSPELIGGSPHDLYKHMVKYRNLALAGNDGTGTTPIPYGMWLQCFKGGQWSRYPSISEMRLQQFAALTFGYTHLTAFIYNDYTADLDGVFFDGTPWTTNDPTPALTAYGLLNKECLNMGPALIRLQSVDVRWIPGEAYANPEKYAQQTEFALWQPGIHPYITSITASNLGTLNNGRRGDVLVGYFRPLLPEFEDELFDGNPYPEGQYFMVTNGLSDAQGTPEETQQSVRMTFDFGATGVTSLQRLRRSDGQAEDVPLVSDGGARYHLDIVLPGGTGDLFRFGAPACQRTWDGPCPDFEKAGTVLYTSLAQDWETADLDGNGIPDSWEVALFAEVLCDGRPSLAVCTFAQNVEALTSLLAEKPLEPAIDAIAALLAISSELRDVDVLAAVSAGTEVISVGLNVPSEPFSAKGDLDGDGRTNFQEFNNTVGDGLKTENYVAAAIHPLLDGALPSSLLPLVWLFGLTGLAGALGAAMALRVRRKNRGTSSPKTIESDPTSPN